MGLHQTKKLLQKKGNNYQNQKKTYRIEKIFASDSLDKGPISRIYKDLKKLNDKKTPQRIQLINGQMTCIVFKRSTHG
jgi:hypothetical protein